MDLSTKYLGLTLQNPLVAAASPLSEDLDKIRQLEDAGASAVVMESLFEEQIDVDSFELDRHLSGGAESFAEALSYFPDLSSYNTGPDGYLEQIAKAKAAVKIPIIASLNGVSSGGWIRYAKKMEQAGADALELNIYTIPTDPALTSELVEQAYVTLVSGRRLGTRHSGRCEARSVLHEPRQPVPPPRSGRSQRPGPLQPFLPARFRPRSSRGSSQPQAQHPV